MTKRERSAQARPAGPGEGVGAKKMLLRGLMSECERQLQQVKEYITVAKEWERAIKDSRADAAEAKSVVKARVSSLDARVDKLVSSLDELTAAVSAVCAEVLETKHVHGWTRLARWVERRARYG